MISIILNLIFTLEQIMFMLKHTLQSQTITEKITRLLDHPMKMRPKQDKSRNGQKHGPAMHLPSHGLSTPMQLEPHICLVCSSEQVPSQLGTLQNEPKHEPLHCIVSCRHNPSHSNHSCLSFEQAPSQLGNEIKGLKHSPLQVCITD